MLFCGICLIGFMVWVSEEFVVDKTVFIFPLSYGYFFYFPKYPPYQAVSRHFPKYPNEVTLKQTYLMSHIVQQVDNKHSKLLNL